MRKLFRRLFYLLNRSRLECELREEMRAHREMMAPDRGRSFGNDLLLREEARDAWGWTWLDQLRQDVAYGIRILLRSPAFTLSAVTILALGIGANLAVFHIFNAALFHRVSVPHADSIVHFQLSGGPGGNFPYPAVEFLRRNSDVLAAVIAEKSGEGIFFEDDLEPEDSAFVSGNYFGELGIRPAYGRWLDAGDSEPGAPLAAVISHKYWQRRFGSDPDVAGRIIHLSGQPVRIAGVAPPDFSGLSYDRGAQPAFWLPITSHPALFSGSTTLASFAERDTELYAKLKPGVSIAAAEAQLNALMPSLREQHPSDFRGGESIRGRPLLSLPDLLPREALPAITLVTLLVSLVLITACANLGNILLARGQVRAREIDTRLWVGAGPWRIVRQLMVENGLIALLGAGAALLLAYFAARTLLASADAAPGIHVETDWRMILAAAGLALFSALVFGLAPAMQSVRRTTKPARTRKILVAVQVGASCFLLILASVLARSAQRQLAIHLRFDYRGMIVLDPQLQAHHLASATARQVLDRIAARLTDVPGVTGVTESVFPPFGGRMSVSFGPGQPRISYNQVTPSYFALMNLPIVRGRLFSATEKDAVVLSESAARAMWPAGDPMGKTLRIPQFTPMEKGKTLLRRGAYTPVAVVGVVKDSGSSQDNGIPEAYIPVADSNWARTMLIVHYSGDAAAAARDIRAAASLPGLVPSAWLMRSRAEHDAGPPPGILLGISSLSLTATLLAAMGIFGLIAFSVAQRTPEIGVRMAFGAGPMDIVETVLSQYAGALGAGAAAGVALAITFGLILGTQIVGLQPFDPISYAAALIIFTLVALVAILVPARRALRIDPAAALRWE